MNRLLVSFPVAFALALLGCGKSEFERAKERYAFLKAHGATTEQLCEEGKKVVSAAVDEKSDEYDLLSIENDLACNQVALDRL